MAQINKSSDYFNTVLYTGNGYPTSNTQSITGVGFQPDWIWIKARSGTDPVVNHALFDSVRGTSKQLKSNQDVAEASISGVTSFDSDGFTLGSNADSNWQGNSLVAWNWLAGGTASSNTDGSITSSVSANTTAGFSIVSYTGAGGNQTIGHGLGVVPSMILVKTRSTGGDWTSYHSVLGNTKFMRLNSTNAVGTQSTYWQDTDPTSSVFSVGNAGDVNFSGQTHIAYCFAEKKGFSKFGSYTGNGNADGPFVYTGFKPAWVMAKRTGTAGQNWEIHDNKRPEYNSSSKRLWANLNNAEATEDPYLDLVSNGFKIKTNDTNYNASDSYIYMAFAESPLVGTNNIPATAR